MDKPLFERTLGAIQRDRLSDFFKESHDIGDGCFYYALISSHNYLYPNSLLPRNFVDKIRKGGKLGKGIVIGDVISEVKRLEPDLKLKVDHIINHTNLSAEEITQKLPIKDIVPVVDSIDGWVKPEPGASTALTLLVKKGTTEGHYLALVENHRFENFGELMGGNTEYQRIKDEYTGGFSFVVTKSE
jgi:hypothetical protein